MPGLYWDLVWRLLRLEDGVPAVLKIIKKVGLGIGPRREMRYLHLVNLLLHAEASKSSFFIVMKDVRVDFPNKGDPPLKLFHEWYLDDRDMIAEEGLVKLRKIVKTRLRGFAHDEKINLLYSDFHLLNLYMGEKVGVRHAYRLGTRHKGQGRESSHRGD